MVIKRADFGGAPADELGKVQTVCLCPRLQIPEAVPDSVILYARHAYDVSIVSRNGCKWYEGEINKTSILYLGEDNQ